MRLRFHPAIAWTVILICPLLLLWLFWPIHELTGQIAALVSVFLVLRYTTPVARWFLAMPIPHRIVLALLLGGVIAGHFSFNTRTYFPFVTWEIFPRVREENPVTCRQFIGTTAIIGEKRRLLVEQLFPSIVQFDPPADNDSPAMTDLVHALAVEYNRQHPDDKIGRVDLIQMAVPLDGSPPTWHSLKRYDIPSR